MARIVVLTGAGISVESGLSTFRGPDGLWEGHRAADVATPEGFAADPILVQRFYNGLRRQLHDVEPNPAHIALAQLEQVTDVHVVTQNIDDLHQRAGTTAITAMHGELTKIRHTDTGEVLTWTHDVRETETTWRPHVVWFGERTIGLDSITNQLRSAEVFIAIGTSGAVYPANQFAAIANAVGATTIEINVEPSGGSFDHTWIGRATEEVPKLMDYLSERTYRPQQHIR